MVDFSLPIFPPADMDAMDSFQKATSGCIPATDRDFSRPKQSKVVSTKLPPNDSNDLDLGEMWESVKSNVGGAASSAASSVAEQVGKATDYLGITDKKEEQQSELKPEEAKSEPKAEDKKSQKPSDPKSSEANPVDSAPDKLANIKSFQTYLGQEATGIMTPELIAALKGKEKKIGQAIGKDLTDKIVDAGGKLLTTFTDIQEAEKLIADNQDKVRELQKPASRIRQWEKLAQDLLIKESSLKDDIEISKKKYPELSSKIDEVVNSNINDLRKYFNWIVVQLTHYYKLEDIIPTVKYYDENIQRFKFKDINNYKNSKELEDEIKDLKYTKTRSQIKAEDVEVLHEADKKVQDPDSKEAYTLRYIGSREASEFYGADTKWCITMQNASYYEQYTSTNTVFYFIENKLLPARDPRKKVAFAIQRDFNNKVITKEIDGKKPITIWDAANKSLNRSELTETEGYFLEAAIADASAKPKGLLARIKDGQATKNEIVNTFKYADSEKIREAIIINVPKEFLYLGISDKNDYIRFYVADNIDLEYLPLMLPPIILNREDASVIERVVKRIDPEYLPELMNIYYEGGREIIAERIDERYLPKMMADNYFLVRLQVSKRIAPEYLIQMMDDNNMYVRREVANRMKELGMLSKESSRKEILQKLAKDLSSIKKLTSKADLQQAAELEEAAFNPKNKNVKPFDSAQYLTYGIKDKDVVIAAMRLNLKPTLEWKPDSKYEELKELDPDVAISSLVVESDYRKQGIATDLINLVKSKYDSVLSGTGPKSSKAMPHIMKQHGFKPIIERKQNTQWYWEKNKLNKSASTLVKPKGKRIRLNGVPLPIFELFPGMLESEDGHITATRFTQREGSSFSGWVVRSNITQNYSDPLYNKEFAIKTMLEFIKDEVEEREEREEKRLEEKNKLKEKESKASRKEQLRSLASIEELKEEYESLTPEKRKEILKYFKEHFGE